MLLWTEGTKCFDFIESIMQRDNMIQSDDSDFWCCSVNGVSISYNTICQLCRFVVLSSLSSTRSPSLTPPHPFNATQYLIDISVRIDAYSVSTQFSRPCCCCCWRCFCFWSPFSFFFFHVIVFGFFSFILSLSLYLSHSISNCLEISAFSLSRIWSKDCEVNKGEMELVYIVRFKSIRPSFEENISIKDIISFKSIRFTYVIPLL